MAAAISLVELIKAALYGVIEGVTEWLPISSTGHMLLFEKFVQLQVSAQFWHMFLVVIQLGAILAVCVTFCKQLNFLAPSLTPSARKNTLVLWAKIIVACIPAAAVGIPLDDWMDEHLSSPYIIAAALIVYGVAFIVVEKIFTARERALGARAATGLAAMPAMPAGAETLPHHAPKHMAVAAHDACAYTDAAHAGARVGTDAAAETSRITTLEALNWKTTIGIGIFQVLSIVPGTSRSGSTILGARMLGCSRSVAAQFTFLLAVPVMVGASALRLVKYILKKNIPTSNEAAILAVGCIVAFVVSLCVIHGLMRYIKRHDFQVFGWYRIVLGIITIAYFALV